MTDQEKVILENILEIPEETQTLEFKRMTGEKVVSKITETIVAMANTDGGVIVLGIDDPEKTKLSGYDRVYGIEEDRENFDGLLRHIQTISPPLANIVRDIINVTSNKSIVLLRVPKSVTGFCSVNNEVFVRLHKSNKKLNPTEIIKLSYAKGFERADRELVADVSLELLDTQYFRAWSTQRELTGVIEEILFKTGLARRNDSGVLLPTRAAILLFAEFPTDITDTKSAIKIFQYSGTIETIGETPNLISTPKIINGPLIKQIKDAQEYVLLLLRAGIEIHSGFVTKYRLPERAIKEGITNAVIHRDYHLKRDIEISIFEDRIEFLSPGLLPFNITSKNIGFIRADGYRNDLIVKHLREFPEPPNLDQNEGVRAIRSEMREGGLYHPIYITYPTYEDSVKLILLNELRQTEWECVEEYLTDNRYINNSKAREITNVKQLHEMSRLFRKWVKQGLLIKINPESGGHKATKYKLAVRDDLSA